jgi:hypothetical protein
MHAVHYQTNRVVRTQLPTEVPKTLEKRRKLCFEITWVASISWQIVGLRLWMLGAEADPGMLLEGSY